MGHVPEIKIDWLIDYATRHTIMLLSTSQTSQNITLHSDDDDDAWKAARFST